MPTNRAKKNAVARRIRKEKREEFGMAPHEVWVLPDDLIEIRRIEKESQVKAGWISESTPGRG